MIWKMHLSLYSKIYLLEIIDNSSGVVSYIYRKTKSLFFLIQIFVTLNHGFINPQNQPTL